MPLALCLSSNAVFVMVGYGLVFTLRLGSQYRYFFFMMILNEKNIATFGNITYNCPTRQPIEPNWQLFKENFSTNDTNN